MNFATVKGLTIPEGNVESIAIGGQTVWAKAPDDPWTAVFASIDDGTYKEKYSIGDTVPLDLGSEGVVNMEVVAFDADDLDDGSGKAPISWVSKELLATQKRMNVARETASDGTYVEGTGSIGGWKFCEMRNYLNETIKPMIPSNVRSKIVTVKKEQTAITMENKTEKQVTEDDVWIPSASERNFYEGLNSPANGDKTKRVVGTTTAIRWWFRTAGTGKTFEACSDSGGITTVSASVEIGIALGFCT